MNQNAMSTHTAPGCYQDESSTFNAQFMMSSDNKNNCDPNQTSGQGCGVRSDSTASYGPNYNAAKGGVYALLWNDGVSPLFLRLFFVSFLASYFDVSPAFPRALSLGESMC